MQSRSGGVARNTIVNGGGLFVLAGGAVSKPGDALTGR
jgi:hypothetical protein